MALSCYGRSISPQKIIEQVPVLVNKKGEEEGSLLQHLASWCMTLGYTVSMYTADCEIIDTTWATLPKVQLLERMKLAMPHRNVTDLGKKYSTMYMQSYIDFVQAGGTLTIVASIGSDLLYELLEKGPVIAGVSFRTLWGTGHNKSTGLRQMEHSDTGKGNAGTHAVTLYGFTETGDILIADPWVKPGLHIVKIDHVIASISAAQINCDNLLFQIAP